MEIETLGELFIHSTEKYATQTAYEYEGQGIWQDITYREVYRKVEQLSEGLKAYGLKHKDHIGIMAENSLNWALIDYAIICSKGVPVTIYPSLTAKQAKWILLHSEAKYLFCGSRKEAEKILKVCDDLPKIKKVILLNNDQAQHKDFITLEQLFIAGKERMESTLPTLKDDINSINKDDVATIIYTSGTTGTPKGVMLTHKNITSNICDSVEALEINKDDKLLAFLPLSHAFQRTTSHFAPFAVGSTVCYPKNKLKVIENMTEVNPTILVTVPRLLEKLYTRIISKVEKKSNIKQNIFWWAVERGKKIFKKKNSGQSVGFLLEKQYNIADQLVFSKVKEKLGDSLNYMISGGAPLPKKVSSMLNGMGIEIIEGYGLTETSPVVSGNRLGKNKIGTVGKPLPSVEVKTRKDGELLIKGPNVMKGYYKNEEQTQKVFTEDGWLISGDIVEIDEDNYITITDRKKHIIVTASGKNVAPNQLEGNLVTSKWIEQALVIGNDKKYLTALVVPSFPNLEDWAEDNNIAWDNREELLSNPKVQEVYDHTIKESMEGYAQFERIRKYQLLPDEFTIEDGELTPSLKIKREVVLDKYSELISEMYN